MKAVLSDLAKKLLADPKANAAIRRILYEGSKEPIYFDGKTYKLVVR